MENKDINTLLFRCSSLGHLIGGVREKENEIQETVKTNLIDCFVSWKYGRKEFKENKFLEKGNEREEDSITLLSLEKNKMYIKNTVRLSNDFITGEPDLFDGSSLLTSHETTDTKTSFSAHTFYRAKQKELEKLYEWQGVGYMWLTGAKKHTVAYCLVNGTAKHILKEKYNSSFKFGLDYEKNPEYIKKCKQIEINHIFDLQSFCNENPNFEFHNDLNFWNYDIPRSERIFTFEIQRDEKQIEYLKNRTIQCRKWINENLNK